MSDDLEEFGRWLNAIRADVNYLLHRLARQDFIGAAGLIRSLNLVGEPDDDDDRQHAADLPADAPTAIIEATVAPSATLDEP